MGLGRDEALSEARKLVRTLGSAPNPQQQAQTALTLLMRSGPWPPAAQRQILDLAAWLATRPQPAAIKPRCQAVLKALDGR
jgi:hypothetical protein